MIHTFIHTCNFAYFHFCQCGICPCNYKIKIDHSWTKQYSMIMNHLSYNLYWLSWNWSCFIIFLHSVLVFPSNLSWVLWPKSAFYNITLLSPSYHVFLLFSSLLILPASDIKEHLRSFCFKITLFYLQNIEFWFPRHFLSKIEAISSMC